MNSSFGLFLFWISVFAVALPFAIFRSLHRKKKFFYAWLWCGSMVFVFLGTLYFGFLMMYAVEKQPTYLVLFLVFLFAAIISIVRDLIQKEKERSTNPNQPQQLPNEEKNSGTLGQVILFSVMVIIIIFSIGFTVSSPPDSSSFLWSFSSLFSNPGPTPTPLPTKTKTQSPTVTLTRRPTNSPAPASNSFVDELLATSQAGATQTAVAPACYSWEDVTLSHVGKTLCVHGIVKKAWYDYQQGAFFMTFGNDPDDLYLIVYGAYYKDIQNHCVQLTGEIKQLGQTPVLTVYNGTMYSCDE